MNTPIQPARTRIRPRSGRGETLMLLMVTLAVLLSVTGYLLWRPERSGPPTPLSWQVRSFDGLGPVDQAIHSALLPAGEEIIWNNDDTGEWISLERAQKMLLPPFYRDGFWRSNGEVHWQLVLPGTHLGHQNPEASHAEDAAPASEVSQATQGQGATVYYGSGGHAPGQSAYLLVIGHAHAGVMWANQATIWIHSNPNAPYPAIVKAESLVGEGWRQVIPYDGSRELERVQGTPP
ncbi:hypothetical protein [Pseudomonas cremoricolorata]|uniref:hypothetical protein n=1 Tax=Pseudomonas cremoricolorata TaxID=157783 RepID=UPI000675D294|nr:hypothetical protein [Pseudomonas cremoricolorata]